MPEIAIPIEKERAIEMIVTVPITVTPQCDDLKMQNEFFTGVALRVWQRRAGQERSVEDADHSDQRRAGRDRHRLRLCLHEGGKRLFETEGL